TAANTGTLNPGTAGAVAFQGIQTFIGGTGTDTLDYAKYSDAVTVNLQLHAATGLGSFINMEGYVGSTGSTLIGSKAPTVWKVTGLNQGTVAGSTFSGFANLTGGSGNDSFRFDDGAGVTGMIDGGGGINALVDSAYSTGVYVNLLGGVATGTGGVINIEQ